MWQLGYRSFGRHGIFAGGGEKHGKAQCRQSAGCILAERFGEREY